MRGALLAAIVLALCATAALAQSTNPAAVTTGALTFTNPPVSTQCLEELPGGGVVPTGSACAGGSVTSVAMTVPGVIFSVAGSPVTTTGTLALSLISQSANRALVSPNGSSGTPTFRALAGADLPVGSLPAQTGLTPATAGSIGEEALAVEDGTSQAVTVSHATPAVVTMTGNTFAANCTIASGSVNQCIFPIYFTGLGGSAGLSNTTPYYVDPASISGSSFEVATTVANAIAGTDVATTGTDSGTGVEAFYLAAATTVEQGLTINLTGGWWRCTHVATSLGVASTAPTLMAAGLNHATSLPSLPGLVWLPLTFTTGAVKIAIGGDSIEVIASQTSYSQNIEETWTGGATNPTVTGQITCTRFQ